MLLHCFLHPCQFFYNFQKFCHSFVYVNIFSSGWEQRHTYWFNNVYKVVLFIRKSNILTSLLILNFFFDSKWLLLSLNCLQKILLHIIRSVGQFYYITFGCYFYIFFAGFAVKMVRKKLSRWCWQWSINFQNIFIFAYTNVTQGPINNLKVKCLQFTEKLSDILSTCPSQIFSDKLREFLIPSFWSCDFDFWYT